MCFVRNAKLLHPTCPTQANNQLPSVLAYSRSSWPAERARLVESANQSPVAVSECPRGSFDSSKQTSNNYGQERRDFARPSPSLPPFPVALSAGRPLDQTKQITVPDKPAKFGPFLGLKVDELSNPPSRRRGGRAGRRGGGASDGGGRWNLSPVRPRLAVCLEFRLSALRVIIPGRDGYERDLLRHLGEDIPDQVWRGLTLA